MGIINIADAVKDAGTGTVKDAASTVKVACPLIGSNVKAPTGSVHRDGCGARYGTDRAEHGTDPDYGVWSSPESLAAHVAWYLPAVKTTDMVDTINDAFQTAGSTLRVRIARKGEATARNGQPKTFVRS